MPPKLLTGRRRVERDAVICATGYRRNLERLVGHLGVLDVHGIPKVRGEKAAAEGLRFVGFMPRPGALGSIAKEAKHAARAIARELAKTQAAASPYCPRSVRL